MKYALGAVLAAFIFAGCGDDDVGLVKNYTLPNFKSMNIGTAIEGSKICKNITWSKEENGGLKTVKMVCDADIDKSIEMKSKDLVDAMFIPIMGFYGEGKFYNKESFLKLANEHCNMIDSAKLQEIIKTNGNPEDFIPCDDKLKSEMIKGDSSIADSTADSIIKYLKKAFFFSQLTLEQIKQFAGTVPSKATAELNFIVNNDKSVSLSDKFKVTQDGKEDRTVKSSKEVIANFYQR